MPGGLPISTDTPPSPQELAAAFAIDPPAAEPASQVAPEAQPVAPAPVAPPAAPVPETPLDQAVAPAEFTFAGRHFRDQAEAERAYTEMQSRDTRTTEQYRAAQAQLNEYGQLWTQIKPILEERVVAQPVAAPVPIDFNEDPAGALRAIITPILTPLQQEVADLRRQVSAPPVPQAGPDPQVAEYQRRNLEASQSFLARHPEVAAGTPAYFGVDAILKDQPTFNLDATDPEQIEFAYQMWQYPRLAEVARMAPNYVREPFGRDMLRSQAQLPPTLPVQQVAPANGNGQAPTGGAAPARPAAFVETGGTGAPVVSAPGQSGQKDDFDDVIALAERLRRESSPLMGGRKS